MPRRLLHNLRIVEDEWSYAADAAAGATSVIVTFEQWRAERSAWLARGGRLGLVLQPADKVEELAADVPQFQLLAAQFPGPGEGRGYTQARLLRERYGFKGELRATGYVRLDQLFFLARCGFNAFELPDSDFAGALAALQTFTAAYQPSNDDGLAQRLPEGLPLKTSSDIPASA